MSGPVTGAWRAMDAADLDAVLAIADRVHPDYPEDRAVFAERLALFPPGCRLALADGAPVGYAVMHPGVVGAPPPLDSSLGALPAAPDCLYLHDFALLTAARGLGLGGAALAYAHAVAAERGWTVLALTSTPTARSYWDAQGFTPYEGGPALAAKLASYGEGMAYMTAPVRAG